MSAKMLKISILGVLVIMGLGVGFVVSILTKGSDQDAPGQTETAFAQRKITPLPPGASDLVAIQPKQSLLNELVKELRYKIEESQRLQLELEKREKRIATAEAGIKQDAEKLENLLMQLAMPLGRLQDKIAELERTRIRISTREKAEVQKTAAIYEKMDAASSSQILVEMCTNSEEDAVKILYYMSERSAAKCLAEIPDKALAAKLSQKIKVINEES